MSLKFKRNYPIILLLIAILAFLTLAMGNQRIVAYTARTQDQQTEPVGGTRLDVTDDVAPLDSYTRTLTLSVSAWYTELLGQNISQY